MVREDQRSCIEEKPIGYSTKELREASTKGKRWGGGRHSLPCPREQLDEEEERQSPLLTLMGAALGGGSGGAPYYLQEKVNFAD